MAPHPRRITVEDPDDDAHDGRMGFLEHLDELRTRIIRSCAAIGAGMLVAFAFHDRLADIVLAPIERTLPSGSSLVFIRPGEGFSLHLNVAFIGGFLLAAPFVMHQVWRFIAPGLYANEKKLLVPFVVLTSAGSVCGALFSQYVLFPGLMTFYAAFSSPRMRFLPGVDATVDLYMKMMIGMIVVFQIPTVVFFLAKMRLVTARFLWRHLQYAVLIIFILAAALTPDGSPWNQAVVAAPMIGLYLLSIGLAWMVAPAPQNASAAEADSTKLRLVFAATVIDQARRQRRIKAGDTSRGRPRIRALDG
jgi:sec-independent protein translocase protein TatC